MQDAAKNRDSAKWGAVIVAAGGGARFGGALPKQYTTLAGCSVLARAIEAVGHVARCAVVVDPAHAAHYQPILAQYPHIRVVPGGSTRSQSVANGVAALDTPYVLVHDAARPLLDPAALARIKAVIEGGAQAATLAVPVSDTLLRGQEIIDRVGVVAIQTPQAFVRDLLLRAHGTADAQAYTDDASLVYGETRVEAVQVPGNPDNFKITTADDLARAHRILLARADQIRSGFALDFHRFGPGSGVRLFGVDLPCDHALIGHSDADAGLHAIADAILGTIGAGDIGMLFSPNDPQWKGMDSARIVARALDLLRARGGILVNADIMLMSEFPRIGPHRAAIVARLSEILGLAPDAIGLKATTTEGMGAIGRGEGVAVQALVSVRVPS
ncbi:MAG: 2-C-methyl-D-erythritol 2,4-cyclodiphosphate synthase [Rhodospirillales bacterium]|nr:2-C-methyl-D-erythritol 2,4-cyclodiphosphate synthase [Alphaproteobacteria bacterium]MCB9987536.1 2-C-methyl-D-erythritol 2,4-cyclodiphosphate synthase [Rhodospirillales bacterium]USO07741.1 MAG: 2-C-methyl-D-erythritol 2,4-cyclodiphosphate synthase [Rhodospirillales bacterium]